MAQPDPDGFLGPWALHLTAFSPTLIDFGGGPGTVAIHGRAGASLRDPLGTARSHGCIRIPNEAIRLLASVAREGPQLRSSASTERRRASVEAPCSTRISDPMRLWQALLHGDPTGAARIET